MEKRKPLGKEAAQPFENTPIYRTSEAVLSGAHTITSRMSKSHKYITGTRLCDSCLELSEHVSLAYIETESVARKLDLVSGIEKKCISVLILHRIANSLNLINRSMYVDQVDRVTSIIKQARGWKSSLKNTNST